MDKQAIGSTASELRELLLYPPYAAKWQARIGRRQSHTLHQSGVCQVMAEYLWSNNLHPRDDEALPRKLKDRVCRALAGHSLSLATLRWFTEAFGMTAEHTTGLLQRAGSDWTVIPGAAGRPGVLPPRRYRTVSLREWHRIGPDGLPESHRTRHVIRAEERIDRYSCLFDADAASVRVTSGGRCGQPYPLGDGLFAVDILLPDPLQPGEVSAMDYETTFWYRTPPPAECRRAASGRIENLDLHLQFHHLRLPQRVWWSEWPAEDAGPVRSEQVQLDAEKAVQRSVAALERKLVGFRWEIVQPRR